MQAGGAASAIWADFATDVFTRAARGATECQFWVPCGWTLQKRQAELGAHTKRRVERRLAACKTVALGVDIWEDDGRHFPKQHWDNMDQIVIRLIALTRFIATVEADDYTLETAVHEYLELCGELEQWIEDLPSALTVDLRRVFLSRDALFLKPHALRHIFWLPSTGRICRQHRSAGDGAVPH